MSCGSNVTEWAETHGHGGSIKIYNLTEMRDNYEKYELVFVLF